MVRQQLDCPDISRFLYMEKQRLSVLHMMLYTQTICLREHIEDMVQLRVYLHWNQLWMNWQNSWIWMQ